MSTQEIQIVRFEEASSLKQSSCPFCGDPLDWGKSKLHQHVTGYVMGCECGTRLCPDFEGERGVQSRSLACEKIADLRARLARVERNHMRRIEWIASVIGYRYRDDHGHVKDRHGRLYLRFAKACRAALATMEGR